MNALGLHAALDQRSATRSSLAAIAACALLLAASSAQALSFSPSCFTNHPGTAAVADFNHDGNMDVALSTEVQVPGGLFLGLNVEVYLGHGDGTFGTAITLNGLNSAGILNLIAADANNDGNIDIVTANGQGTISVFEGHGDGTFSSMKNYGAVQGAVTGVAAGDFNGDGRMDIAAVDGVNASVAVLLGTGKGGGLKSRVRYGTGFPGRAIVATDVNGDGKTDLVTANAAANGPLGTTLSVLLGNGDGTFGAPSLVNLPKFTGRTLFAADFNQDGKADLVLGTQNLGDSGILELLGNGDGTFAPAVYQATSTNGANLTATLSVAVGDVNGDGRPDVVAGNRRFDANFLFVAADATVLLAQANGSLVIDDTTPTHFSVGLVVADFNGDGRADIETDDCVQLQTGPVVQSIRAGGEDPAPPAALTMSFAPNPWHADGRVSFTLPQSGPVSLALFDIGGRRVLSIAEGEWLAAGAHSFPMEQGGASISPGVYLCRLQTLSGALVQRIVVAGR
jgi:hypothetical protein